MKIQLETIPVWDGIRSGSECYLCDLRNQAQSDSIRFYLGPSVMNPETRVEINANGFCNVHFAQLAEANKPQGLGLVADTYLATLREELKDSMDALLHVKGGRKTDKAVSMFTRSLQKRKPHCLICEQIENREMRYLHTTAYLFGQDPDFRKALARSKGFCLMHYQRLLEISKEVLDDTVRREFISILTEVEMSNLQRLQEQVLWMTQKYKSENFDKPWNDCEDAQKRVVSKLILS